MVQTQLLKSALTITNPFNSIDDIKKWITQRNEAVQIVIENIRFGEMDKWKLDRENGLLKHTSGRFFTIEGINITTNWGKVGEWEQPIINQPEIDNYISTQSLIDQFSFLPDFIIIHSVTHFINAKNINEIYKATNKPIFWNLLDMAPMTGGCHYAWDCEGYKKHCGYCPGLSSKREKDVSRKNYEFKSRYLSEIPLTIIPPTHTLLQQVNSSSLFRDNAKVKIMLAVDATIFKPGEKSLARKTFNLSPSAKIIFAGSQDVTEERKGYHYFIESLEKLNELLTPNERENIIVLLAGHINKKALRRF